MNCSMAESPVLYYLPEFAQTHVHWVSDAIQPSHPLSPPSLDLNLSQHQGLFQWVSSSNQVAKVLEFQRQHQSFQWIFRTDFLEDGLVWSPCSPKDSQEASPTLYLRTSSSKESACQETWVQSLGWEDPLEKKMAAYTSILAWRIPWTEEPGGLQSMGCKESHMTEWLTLHFITWN